MSTQNSCAETGPNVLRGLRKGGALHVILFSYLFIFFQCYGCLLVGSGLITINIFIFSLENLFLVVMNSILIIVKALNQLYSGNCRFLFEKFTTFKW